MTRKILLLPGDGIGAEVVREAKKIIEWLNSNHNTEFVLDEALIGGAAYDATGTPFPPETLEKAKKADAILLGAVGGPKWENLDYSLRPERGLLAIRKELGLFANLRPAIVFDELADASTLKREIVSGLDILIVRELTGDLYFGTPRGVETLPDGTRRGVNTLVYTSPEVQRIARVAFDLAKKRGKKLCSVDKANVLEATEMWRQEVQKIGDTEYPEIQLSHMYVDNAAMQLVRNPKQFDVMLTTNVFGDILSDCAAMLTGSLGMLPSASLGFPPSNSPRKRGENDTANANPSLPPLAGGAGGGNAEGNMPGLYEPVHGSAPDIAGKNIANPIATILSLVMMLRYSFSLDAEAELVEGAVKSVLARGLRTADIMQPGMKRLGTDEMGDAVVAELN